VESAVGESALKFAQIARLSPMLRQEGLGVPQEKAHLLAEHEENSVPPVRQLQKKKVSKYY